MYLIIMLIHEVVEKVMAGRVGILYFEVESSLFCLRAIEMDLYILHSGYLQKKVQFYNYLLIKNCQM